MENALPQFQYPRRKHITKYECDILSTCMIPSDIKHKNLASAYLVGDGNCLYNTLSMDLFGNFSRSTELCCRVAYELWLQNDMYNEIAKECLYYDQPSVEYISDLASLGTHSGVLEVITT